MGGHRGTPVAADLSLRGLGFHLLSMHGLDSIPERLIGRAALGAIALVGALAIVELHVAIQVALQLVQRCVERLAERHTVELLFHRAMEPLTEPVRLRRADIGSPVLDLLDGQVEPSVSPWWAHTQRTAEGETPTPIRRSCWLMRR